MPLPKLNSTATSSTVKRTHVEQIIKAWNGSLQADAAPLLLNHNEASTGSMPTPLKIIVNSTSNTGASPTKAIHVVNESGTDLFYVTRAGVVYPPPGAFTGGGTALLPTIAFASGYATGLYGSSTEVAMTATGSRTFGSATIGGINYNIFNASLISSDTMTTNFEAIVLRPVIPPSNTAGSGYQGVKHVLRSYAHDGAVKTRDYALRSTSNTFSSTTAVEGYLEIFGSYATDSPSETSIAKFHHSGLFTGKFAPDKDWPPTTATPSTETAAITTFPRGAIPVYKVVQSGAGPSYSFSGTWQQLAAGANGYILVADNTVSNGIKWTENSGGGFVRSFLLMGG